MAPSDIEGIISDIDAHLLGDDGPHLRDALTRYQAQSLTISPREWHNFLIRVVRYHEKGSDWMNKRFALLNQQHKERNQRHKILGRAFTVIKEIIRDDSHSSLTENTPALIVARKLMWADPGLIFFFEQRIVNQPLFFEAVRCSKLVVQSAVEILKKDLCKRLDGNENAINGALINKLGVRDAPGNTALSIAVTLGKEDIVRYLLEGRPKLAVPVHKNAIKIAIENCWSGILKELIRSNLSVTPTPQEPINQELAERLPENIIEHGQRDVDKLWDSLREEIGKSIEKNKNSELLHLAVKKRSVGTVNALVRDYPEMVFVRDDNNRLALYYNNSGDHSVIPNDNVRDKIRAAIVPAIIKRKDIGQIQTLLDESNDTSYQTCLDFGDIDTSLFEFSELVDTLVKSIPKPRLGGSAMESLYTACDIKFEAILRHVVFPDLDNMEAPEVPGVPNQVTEVVPNLLEWLYRKGVRSILKLKVPDSFNFPHDESNILKAFSIGDPPRQERVQASRAQLQPKIIGFGVEELDWRKLDLSIEVLQPLAKTLKTLHLYYSGNWAVLSHWTGKQGLEVLEKLELLKITIVRDKSSTDDQVKAAKKRLRTKLDGLDALKSLKKRPEIVVSSWVNSVSLQSVDTAPIEDGEMEPQSVVNDLKLESFMDEYRNHQDKRQKAGPGSNLKPLKRVRVALIDTGMVAIDKHHPYESAETGRIQQGVSFAHLGRDTKTESPYWFPSNEHGDQMANIICELDPYCELYPIQVTNNKSIKSVESVTQAIKWAIKHKVHIISMSFVLWKSTPEFFSEIQKAQKAQVVVICSTADNGNNQQRVYPAMFHESEKMQNIFPVAACNQEGKLLNYSSQADARYHFRGEEVSVRAVPFVKKPSLIVSGSSVATAVAAGIASLTLSCYRMVSGDDASSNAALVQKCFDKMKPDEKHGYRSDYCMPSKVFKDEIPNDDFERFLRKHFKAGA